MQRKSEEFSNGQLCKNTTNCRRDFNFSWQEREVRPKNVLIPNLFYFSFVRSSKSRISKIGREIECKISPIERRKWNLFFKFLSLEKRKKNILQHLEFQGENQNVFFKVLNSTTDWEMKIQYSSSREKKCIISFRDFLEIETRQCLPGWPNWPGWPLTRLTGVTRLSNMRNKDQCKRC